AGHEQLVWLVRREEVQRRAVDLSGPVPRVVQGILGGVRGAVGDRSDIVGVERVCGASAALVHLDGVAGLEGLVVLLPRGIAVVEYGIVGRGARRGRHIEGVRRGAVGHTARVVDHDHDVGLNVGAEDAAIVGEYGRLYRQ